MTFWTEEWTDPIRNKPPQPCCDAAKELAELREAVRKVMADDGWSKFGRSILEREFSRFIQPEPVKVDPLEAAISEAFSRLPPEWNREIFVSSVSKTMREVLPKLVYSNDPRHAAVAAEYASYTRPATDMAAVDTSGYAEVIDLAAVVEALEWYGEQARLCRLIHSGGDEGRHNLQADGGNRASTALQSLRGCKNHPGRPVRDNLDGDDLCQECCDQWVRGERQQ